MEEVKMSLLNSFILLCGILMFFSCDQSVAPENKEITFDLNVLADGLGDHNGIASESEITFVEEYFSANNEAWSIGGIPPECCDVNANDVPADILFNT